MGGDLRIKEQKLQTLIEELKGVDCWIENKTLREITSYDSKVVPHLEDILRNALQKSSSLNLKIPQSSVDWFGVVHAFYLLAHLRSEKSLDLILEFLSQKQEILDYWLHDLLAEDIWDVLYFLGQNQLEKLQSFILNQGNNVFSRLASGTALIQIGLHHRSKKQQVVNIFKKVLVEENDEPDFIGLIASELLDLKEEALRSIIIYALEKNGVWSGIISPEEVNKSYESNFKRKLTPLGLFKRYKQFRQYTCFAQSSSARTPQKVKHRNLHDLL